MLNLLLSVFILGLIIAIHEFGHFLFAKLFHVGVVEFSIGMGPLLFSFVKGETRYGLRLLPFGGFCMMVDSDLSEEAEQEAQAKVQQEGELLLADPNRAGQSFSDGAIIIDGRRFEKDAQFCEKPSWQRFLIIFAGPFFNFVLAFLLSLILTSQAGYDIPVIVQVEEEMPAQKAGIMQGDLVTGVGLSENRLSGITTSRELMLYLTVHERELNAGETVYLRVERGGDSLIAALVPQYSEETDSMRLGLSYNVAYIPAEGIGALLKSSVSNVSYSINATIQSLRLMARGEVSREEVAGPVRMVASMEETVTEASDYGTSAVILTLLNMMIVISGSLGAMNLLPIPGLDGGRLLLIVFELVLRRKLPRELEGRINMIGMAVLILLMAVILLNDITLLIR